MTTSPAPVPSQSLFAKVGRGSPLYIFAIYSVCQFISLAMIALAKGSSMRALVVIAGFVWLLGIVLAFIVVTWFRDDDTVAAGFLLGISIGGGNLAATLVLMIVRDRSLGGAILGFIPLLFPSALVSAIAIAGGMVLISFGRFINPGIATPIPPPRRH